MEAAVVWDATRWLALGAHDAMTESARFSASVARATAADIGCGGRMTERVAAAEPRHSRGGTPGPWGRRHRIIILRHGLVDEGVDHRWR